MYYKELTHKSNAYLLNTHREIDLHLVEFNNNVKQSHLSSLSLLFHIESIIIM